MRRCLNCVQLSGTASLGDRALLEVGEVADNGARKRFEALYQVVARDGMRRTYCDLHDCDLVVRYEDSIRGLKGNCSGI